MYLISLFHNFRFLEYKSKMGNATWPYIKTLKSKLLLGLLNVLFLVRERP